MMRNTHRSRTGKKLYAVRDPKGRFKDIQTYQRVHKADLRRRAKTDFKKKAEAIFARHLLVLIKDFEGLLRELNEAANYVQP